MTQDEFRLALQRGLGRALMFARSNDVSDFRDIILDACLYSRTIDLIFDGTHGSYIYRLIELLPDRQLFSDAIVAALPEDSDSWHAQHRFFLSACLAEDGHPTARQAMYNAYTPGPRHGDGIGICFVHLDGLDGLIFALSKIGANLPSFDQRPDLGWLISHCNSEFGEEAVQQRIHDTSAQDPNVARYLATKEHLSRERSPRRILEKKTWERHQAFEWMSGNTPERRNSIGVLLDHFAPGDHTIALDWYQREHDPQVLHSMETDMDKLWSQYPDPSTKLEMLRSIYEQTYCGFHREQAVHELLELNEITAAMREECAWDSNSDVQALFA